MLTKYIHYDHLIAGFDEYDYILDELPPSSEVERLLKDYKQNQELVRNLGRRYYQVVYPIQVRNSEKFGVSTREVSGTGGYNKYGGPNRGINDPGYGTLENSNQPRVRNKDSFQSVQC